jgi:hypothetical protein
MVDPVDRSGLQHYFYTVCSPLDQLRSGPDGILAKLLDVNGGKAPLKWGVKAHQHGSGIHQCHTTLPEIFV